MVIVTSDHETGYLNGPGSGEVRPAEADSINDVWLPLVNNGQGKLPGMQWNANGHTNSLVPFYAKGAGSRQFKHYADETDLVRGNYLDNTEIAKLIFSFLE
jgi:alkaline phosphatase